MGWTTDNKTEPQGDFGQGSVNNSVGWGQGALNNLVSWGIGHAMTLGHAITNLVGGGSVIPPFLESLDFSLTDWSQLPETGVVYTANEIVCSSTDGSYLNSTRLISLENEFSVSFVLGSLVSNVYMVSQRSSNLRHVGIKVDALGLRGNIAQYDFSETPQANVLYKIEVTGGDVNLYANGILLENATIDIGLILWGQVSKTGTASAQDSNIRYLKVETPSETFEYLFKEGSGTVVSSEVSSNDLILSTTITELPAWNNGVDTPISAGTQTALVTPPLLTFTGQLNHHVDLTAITPNNAEWIPVGTPVAGRMTRDAVGDTDVYCFKVAVNLVQPILSDGRLTSEENSDNRLLNNRNAQIILSGNNITVDQWYFILDTQQLGARQLYIGTDTIAPTEVGTATGVMTAATQQMILGNSAAATIASLNGELVSHLHYTKQMSAGDVFEIWTAIKSNMK